MRFMRGFLLSGIFQVGDNPSWSCPYHVFVGDLLQRVASSGGNYSRQRTGYGGSPGLGDPNPLRQAQAPRGQRTSVQGRRRLQDNSPNPVPEASEGTHGSQDIKPGSNATAIRRLLNIH
jgi:hypothetical protein